jgi:hypothetical protein
MYSEIPQGSSIEIQGLKCHIPPEGYVYNNLTKQVEYRGVYSRSDNPEEQYWVRFQYPNWYKDVTKKEDEYLKKKKEDDPPFYDARYEEYKAQEWDRRLNGYWFMNKGEAVYLTGFYYMLLQWFNIDVGYAKFTIPHLKKTYFLQYCIEDPLCMGMIDVTKRRFLKTFMGGLFVLEYTTRTKMVNGALQSKKGNDAKAVFAKAIVYPFRKFPRFFRPEYDMSLGINPKTEIRFQQTNIRGKKAEDSIDKDELGSMIDWGSADPLHYDGHKIHRYFSDEWGKTTEANVFDRHEVVRYCMLDEEGNIIGKALYSTTVEKLDSDKDGVQDAARQLWDASDQNNREENGRTPSGLYRYFQTADESKNFDIYGYPDIEKTVREILADREAARNNSRSLSGRIRKEPRTIEEAFSEDGDKCIFNIINILEREKELREKPVFKRQILFEMDVETQRVKWRDIRKGEEEFCWHLSEDAQLGNFEDNKVIREGTTVKPGRTKFGAISVDSYSNSQGGRKYGSKASAWIGRKKEIDKPYQSNKAVGHLYGRPPEKDDLHRQIMLASIFYGYQVWFEHNSDSYDSYFRDRGKRAYLGTYPLSCIEPLKKETTVRHRGVPTTPYSLTVQHDNGIAYFENYCHLIDFEDLLTPAKKFDPYDRTKFDSVVSFLILITVLNEPVHIPKPLPKPIIQVFDRGYQLPVN